MQKTWKEAQPKMSSFLHPTFRWNHLKQCADNSRSLSSPGGSVCEHRGSKAGGMGSRGSGQSGPQIIRLAVTCADVSQLQFNSNSRKDERVVIQDLLLLKMH